MLVVLAGRGDDTVVTLPPPPWGSGYRLVWDSADEVPAAAPAEPVRGAVTVTARSMRVYLVDR
nr:hypothetical protein [Angustibacter aerolatus]